MKQETIKSCSLKFEEELEQLLHKHGVGLELEESPYILMLWCLGNLERYRSWRDANKRLTPESNESISPLSQQ